jgi:hypothetical protein
VAHGISRFKLIEYDGAPQGLFATHKEQRLFVPRTAGLNKVTHRSAFQSDASLCSAWHLFSLR